MIPVHPAEWRIRFDPITDEWVVERKCKRFYTNGGPSYEDWREEARRWRLDVAERVVANLARPLVHHYDEEGRRKP
jgi:hypothetical protein